MAPSIWRFSSLLLFLTSIGLGSVSGQCIVINEIMVDGASCDGSCNPNVAEWVELYNPCSTTVNLDCWAMTDGDFALTFPPGTSIPPNSYLTIGGAANEATAPDLNWGTCGCVNYYGTGGLGTFTNGGEQIALFDATGAWVDGLFWSGGQGLPAVGNSAPPMGSCTGQSVTLPASSDPNWESHSTDGGNDCTLARVFDGSGSWEVRCTTGKSFGASNGTVLPAVFAKELEAIAQDQDVALSWSTAEEIDFNRFEVERKLIEASSFKRITLLPGLGQTGGNDYHFTDQGLALGRYLYRLKLVDLDGGITYSNVATAAIGDAFKTAPSLYPNPSEGQFSIDLQDFETVQFQLVDLTGKMVWQDDLAGKTVQQLTLDHLPKGLYYYLIADGNLQFTGKLMLQ